MIYSWVQSSKSSLSPSLLPFHKAANERTLQIDSLRCLIRIRLRTNGTLLLEGLENSIFKFRTNLLLLVLCNPFCYFKPTNVDLSDEERIDDYRRFRFTQGDW